MNKIISEIKFEEEIVNLLSKNGYEIQENFYKSKPWFAINFELLKSKILEVNDISEEIAEKVILEIKKISGNHIEQNIKGINFLKNGVKVLEPQSKRTITIKLISDDITKNHFGVIRQFELIDENGKHRYPDVVCFINGLPMIVIELKAPNANERLEEAFEQNESLKRHFPSLYSFNIFDFLSNRINSRYGSITAKLKRYSNAGQLEDWETENDPITKILNKKSIFKFISLFSFFDDKKIVKYVAAQHQIKAVELTIKKMINNNHKGGIVWHTQGSGKSITMLILTRAIQNHFPVATTIVITDRNTLDRQLFERFAQASRFLMTKPKEINSRNDLIEKLENKQHFGIYFSTVQKFAEKTGQLSKRGDIFILIDEAHRSHNNISGEKLLNNVTKEYITKFGFGKFMRDAFPNAVLTGFTGTPLMGEKMTTDIFGSYNHKYLMNDSVRDGSTVPILYESRRIDIKLNKKYLVLMDDIQHNYALTLSINDVQSEQKMQSLLKSIRIKAFLEDPDIIEAKAKDMLEHMQIRKNILREKSMIVVSSRKAAFEYYKTIITLEPERKESTILVMTHNNKDKDNEERMIVPKHKVNEVANEFRKSNSKYKIVIVVDMWLTGFDVPDLDSMYIDKIIKWHNLMQAIARVNRPYEDDEKTKESGLIIDYLGIWNYLSEALAQYASKNVDSVDIIPEDIEKAKIRLLDQLDALNDKLVKNINQFHKLNSKEQYSFIMSSLNYLLSCSQSEKNIFILKSRAIRRLLKMSYTTLSKDTIINAKAIGVINSLISSCNTQEDEELKITIEKIKEVIEKAVDSSTADVNIKATKINKDINKVAEMLNDEAKQLRDQNPHVAKKLLADSLNGQIAEVKKTRPVFAKKISEKLKEILTKLERDEDIQKVIDMLITLSKEIKEVSNQKPEFNDPHLQSFFTVLADDKFELYHNNSEVLKAIAEDLMVTVHGNITDQFYINKKVRDCVSYELIKILKNKYNYPPENRASISKILVDEIEKTIQYNPEYYVNKKKKEII